MYERYIQVLAVFFTLSFVALCIGIYQKGDWEEQVEACARAKEPPPNTNTLSRGVDPTWDPEFRCRIETERPGINAGGMEDLLYFWTGLFFVSAIVRYIRSGKFIS